MEFILSVIQVAICVVLIFLILMHSGKDAGLSGAFGVGADRFGLPSLVLGTDRSGVFAHCAEA